MARTFKSSSLSLVHSSTLIISYPNEKTVCYGLYNLAKNKLGIKPKYNFLKRPLEKLLNKGKIIDTVKETEIETRLLEELKQMIM